MKAITGQHVSISCLHLERSPNFGTGPQNYGPNRRLSLPKRGLWFNAAEKNQNSYIVPFKWKLGGVVKRQSWHSRQSEK